MGTGVALVKAVKARGRKMLADTGLLSRTGQRAAAAGLVTVLTGLVTGMVTQPGWGLAAGVTLGLLACAGMVQASRQAQQVSVDVLVGEVVTGTTRYGVVRFPAGTGISPGRLLNTVMSSTYGESRAGSVESESVVTLENERDELKKAMKDGRSRVILVHGPPGAGKSTLVHAVLQDMGLESKARLHDLVPGDRLDAKALLDDIESGPQAGAGLKIGEDLLGRLELAMETRRGSPVTIVVDSAQSLFEPDNHMNDQLAEALEVIARGRRRVKVILIVQEHPVPGVGSSWHGTADRVFVGGLRREAFHDFLERLNPAFGFDLADRAEDKVVCPVHVPV